MTPGSRPKLVAGNWKMHGSRGANALLVEALLASLDERAVQTIVCPPAVYLADVWRLLRGGAVALGAQNLCAESGGAFTGEVSGAMLKDVGCEYVIVGHSERRALYGEDNSLVARKFAVAQSAGLIPILCLGEQLAERERGGTFDVIGAQLQAVIELSGAGALERALVAYEPVWAIGTGRTASPEQAQEVHAFIRGQVARHNAKIAAELRILYGGSVKAGNAASLFQQADVDGGLIGGASLKAEEFLAIAAAAAH